MATDSKIIKSTETDADKQIEAETDKNMKQTNRNSVTVCARKRETGKDRHRQSKIITDRHSQTEQYIAIENRR